MEETTAKKRIVCATGMPKLEKELESVGYYDIVGTCYLRSDLLVSIEELKPEVVLISDSLGGEDPLIPLIVNAKKQFPDVRIIYFTNELRPAENDRRDALGMLVVVGVYDIVMSNTLNCDVVIDIIEHPKRYEAVSNLTSGILNPKAEILNALTGIEYMSFDDSVEFEEKADDRIIASLSFKPGTGKSHFASCLACTIVKYAEERKRVCLIEADLQTLSLGTILDIQESPERNLATAMRSIAAILENEAAGTNEELVLQAKKKLKNCFIPYKKVPGLDVLVGSSLSPEEVDALNVESSYYAYLIDFVKDQYDYVIIDLNSSILQKSTLGVLRKCARCYYILNLDINNIRNNIRYKSIIKRLGIEDKVRYILNENIDPMTDDYGITGCQLEDLQFGAKDLEKAGFDIHAKIPVLPKTVFLNRLFEGTPVVLDRNSVDYTNRSKLAFLEVANNITPMGKEYTSLKAKMSPKKGLFGRKKKEISDDGSVSDEKEYGGRFTVNVSPKVHKALYEEAEREGIPFGKLLSEKLEALADK